MIWPLLSACGLGAVAFTSTNIDDIFLLVGFFADPTYRARQVVVGQFLGIAALIALSLLGALGATLLPPAIVGLLGLAPIGLGTKKLLELRRAEAPDEEPARSSSGAILGVAAVTMANGGDNLAVYVPLFSTRTLVEGAAIVVTFLVLTGVWCAVGYALVSHPTIGGPIKRRSRVVMPFVLIGLGVFILIQSRAYSLVL